MLIYTPWKLQDDQYVRFKRKYDLSKLVTLDLYNAVLDENYEYIRENFKEYKEEKQVINKLYETEPIDYFFQAELHMLDKDDILKYNESDLKNTIITVIELIFGLGIGTIINHYRNLDYLLKLKIANNYYSYYPDLIKETKQELSKINEKTLMLSRTMDGKIL